MKACFEFKSSMFGPLLWLMSFLPGHDFEIWNGVDGRMLRLADSDSGMRESAFQYDPRGKVLYSFQPQYDDTSHLRAYDLVKNQVRKWKFPFYRGIWNFQPAVVNNRFYILGSGDSARNELSLGAGEVLFSFSLSESPIGLHARKIPLGDRVGLYLNPIGDSRICVTGFDPTARQYFLSTYDEQLTECERNYLLPQEWTPEEAKRMCDSSLFFPDNVRDIKYEGLPFVIGFSPNSTRILIWHGKNREILLLNSELDECGTIKLTGAEFEGFDASYAGMRWMDENVITIYNPERGDWIEYDATAMKIIFCGKVELERRNDYTERIFSVIGRGKFYVTGSKKFGGSEKSKILEVDRETGKIKSRRTSIFSTPAFYAPDLLLINK